MQRLLESQSRCIYGWMSAVASELVSLSTRCHAYSRFQSNGKLVFSLLRKNLRCEKVQKLHRPDFFLPLSSIRNISVIWEYVRSKITTSESYKLCILLKFYFYSKRCTRESYYFTTTFQTINTVLIRRFYRSRSLNSRICRESKLLQFAVGNRDREFKAIKPKAVSRLSTRTVRTMVL